ncbi:MAG: hypothetical protein ACE5JR_13275 [Gemmatimonadota bacterium]
MPKDKDLKRLVRRRMDKTGESYTTARSKLLDKKNPLPADYARLAGMSDDAVRVRTGKSWKQWVRALDAIDATRMPHRKIAEHVYENYDVSGWWAQTVTVGYERIRGLREVGQRRGGDFEANKSKTIAVPIAKLYRAFSEKRRRERWLPGVDLEIRTSTREKSMRMTWPDETSVEVYFTAKGDAKSQVALQHRKLPSKAAAAETKEYWGDRLEALARLLLRGQGGSTPPSGSDTP